MAEDDTPSAGTPRWVKVFGVIALVAVVLIVIVLIVGGDDHGPGRHAPGSDESGGHTGPPASVTHTQR